MAKREVKEIFPTMKADGNDDVENEFAFRESQAEIVQVYDVSTTFGMKTICVLENEDLGKFQVFINNFSMEKLINVLGDEDKLWIGKIVNLTMEKDPKFNKDMIVINPVK